MNEKINNNKILNFFTTTLNGMAYGLFATLIIGTIIATIGSLLKNGQSDFVKFIYHTLGNGTKDVGGVSYLLQTLTGAGIGIGIALSLKFTPLQTIVMACVGEMASFFSLSTAFVINYNVLNGFKVGDPLTIYLSCIIVAILMKIVFKKKTPVDILIIPLFGIIVGCIISLLVRYPIIYVTYGIQWFVNMATSRHPFIMGIVVAVVMGMALTAPISSAAIAAMIFTLPDGMILKEALELVQYKGLALASGAAIVGCSTQMVGFAIQSRKDNPIGMILSIGLGTSMLQFKNILKKPIIWLPTIISSAILGPLSTCVFKIYCLGSSAGMGTAGLVGQIGTIATMGVSGYTFLCILLLEIILPLGLVFGIDLLFRKFNLIKNDDLKV